MTLWLIGFMFALGLVDDDDGGPWWSYILLFLIWPLAVGRCIRLYLDGEGGKK